MDKYKLKVEHKTLRVVAFGISVISLALSAVGCTNPLGSYVENTPKVSPIVEIVPTDTPTHQEKQKYSGPDVSTYPTSSENFSKTPSISGVDAENRIIEIGAGEDLATIKEWYRASGIADTNMFPVLFEENGKVYWNLALRSETGNFLKFTITSGAEKDQVVRSMGMAAYLFERPTFKLSELGTPNELAGSTQEMVWDRSGWNVLATFRDGRMTGWYNADTNVWTVVNLMPAPTPTENVSLQEPLILLNDRVEYAGLQFDFSFTMLPSDKYVTEKFQKYRIEGLAINEEKSNAREFIAKAIVKSFLETYNFQNKANVDLSTFVANPEKYTVVIVMRGEDNQLVGRKLTINQVKTVEARFASGMRGELYLYMSRYTSSGSGYGFENGHLILFGGITGAFEGLEGFSLSEVGKHPESYPFYAGFWTGNLFLRGTLGQMPYTSYMVLEHGNQQKLISENIFSWYDKILDPNFTTWPTYTGANLDEYFEWWKHYVPFFAVVKEFQ